MQQNEQPLSELPLADLVQRYLEAKAAEDRATAARRAVGDELTRRYASQAPVEGSVSDRTSIHKFSISYGVDRKVTDVEKLREKIPGPVFDRLIRWSPAVNVEELRFLRNNEPEIYVAVTEHVTSKPKAPQFKVDRIVN